MKKVLALLSTAVFIAGCQGSSELKVEDITLGTGDLVAVGDKISVHYIGTLADGTVFESSYDRGLPATFPLVEGGLIQGWVQGIPGMKEGGKRKLYIPAELAYGETARGPIPANSDLVFEVELIEIVE